MSFVVHRVSKSAARYTDAGGREKCAYCRFFVAPRSCGKVIGLVSPRGWCKYFSRQVAQQGSTLAGGGPPGTTLALDFMSSGNMPAGITFTRASPASYQDAAGVIQTAAVDQPRWDYAGGSLRGLLIEEARTNVLLNSATLNTQSVAVTAQSYVLSFYGTGTVTKSGAATGALVGTGAGQRVTQTFTPTAGTLTCTVTGSVTNAQVEAGAWVSSYIPTTGAAVTRAIDQCLISSASMSWFASPGGSWFAEFDFFNPTPNNARIISKGNSAGDLAPLFLFTSPLSASQYDAVGFFNTSTTVAPNTVVKMASTWAVGQAKLCANGGAVATSAALTHGYPELVAAGVSIMTPFNGSSADNSSGHIRRVQYWPRVLSDAEMQQVTT